MVRTVYVITMVIEFEDCEPVDQGVQGVCDSREAVDTWLADNWPTARPTCAEGVWEIFDSEDPSVSLETFLIALECTLTQMKGKSK